MIKNSKKLNVLKLVQKIDKIYFKKHLRKWQKLIGNFEKIWENIQKKIGENIQITYELECFRKYRKNCKILELNLIQFKTL